MARSPYLLLTISLLGVLGACTSPGPQYHFSADQLAWQPYREGQVLRFGNNQTSAVRTYAVRRVHDAVTEQSGGPGFLPLPHQGQPAFESVAAFIQRTDTVAAEFIAMQLFFEPNYPSVIPGNPLLVNAYLGWDTLSDTTLPLDELSQSVPFDTARYGSVRVLPSAVLGPATYAQVVRLQRLYQQGSSPSHVTTTIYFTKASGVVAFEEKKTGLWYRLP